MSDRCDECEDRCPTCARMREALRRERDEAVAKAEAIAQANDQLANAHFEMQAKLQRARATLEREEYRFYAVHPSLGDVYEALLADLAEGGDGKMGWCCACGEGPGPEETPCPKREDKIHCECWWDGEDEGGDE